MNETLDFLADGIRRVNLAYIETPELEKDNYPAMIVQYLISALLIQLGQSANDFGFYAHPEEVGYTGWLTIGDETLFFGPTKIIVLDKPIGEELSPYGEI